MVEINFVKDNNKLIPRYTCGIYAIRNNLNNKMYIGSSNDIRRRYETHFRNLTNNSGINKKLLSVYNKIGGDKFSFLILEQCLDNKDTLMFLELKYIQEYGYYNCNAVDGKPVHCYDKFGNYLRSYKNIKEAGKSVHGILENIRKCCDGKRKSSYGFLWSYVYRNNIGQYHKTEYKGKGCKAVYQCDKYGNIINTYTSIRDASKSLNIPRQNISDCLRKNSSRKFAGGFKWKRVEAIV